MKALGNKVRESLVEAGCVVEEMRVNEEKRRIEGKVTYGRDSLYLRFSPDLPHVWDGVLSSDKERGAFAWGMREAWLHPQAMRPPLVLTDIPEGSVQNAYRVITEEPLHYQGGFYFVKGIMVIVTLLTANGILGLI